MKPYNIFDRDMLDYYIKGPQYVSCVFSAISIVLLICSIINNVIWYLFCVSAFIAGVAVVFYFYCRNMYGYKISINENILFVYKINGKLLRTLKIDNLNVAKEIVLFRGPYNSFIKKKVLILYKYIDVYSGMEYRSYWNDVRILFIQNQELIDLLYDNIGDNSIL